MALSRVLRKGLQREEAEEESDGADVQAECVGTSVGDMHPTTRLQVICLGLDRE